MKFKWRSSRELRRADEVPADPTPGAHLHAIDLPTRHGSEPETMTIRLADCDGQRNRANMLLSRMYEWRGYGPSHPLPVQPNSVTFTATNAEATIGTLTLTVDSDAGLAVDRTFKDEVDVFRRAPGARLCELTRFAFDTSSPARPRLAALFHIIFIYGSMHYSCTDLLIEVNPRHRRFYEAMLGFHPVGEPRTNAGVGAPSQLMWLNVGAIRRNIDRHGGRADNGRSLYPHFFSAKEEQGIYGRLVSMAEQAGAMRSLSARSLRTGMSRSVARLLELVRAA
ncbi:N-acyl amino acid synthase FeeM domain-containing protein [Sphingomonas arenae]|uniref:N-acyl amino acid synthase FeeM domain-containing protein n=1 Tax=Sphingomonas arenae TaxID=2812555 RepID=UPI0019678791|nr:acetyltransferase [Sphingomonas arenae]